MESTIDKAAEMTAWREERRSYLGGTDVAAIIGENQFKSPLQVWYDKKGLSEDIDNPRMRMGREREPHIAQRYVEITGQPIEECGTFRHPSVDFFAANPDRLLVKVNGVLECKSGINRHRGTYGWGDPGTDQVPRIYLVQGVWYAGILNRDFTDYAFEDRETCETYVYRVWRDMEYESMLFEMAEKWWKRFILGDEQPTADERDLEYIKAALPKDSGQVIAAPADLETKIYKAVEIKAQANKLYTLVKDVEAETKLLMGEAAVLTLSTGDKVTWKNNQASLVTDWESVARKVAQAAEWSEADLAAIVGEFTAPKPGARVFRLPK